LYAAGDRINLGLSPDTAHGGRGTGSRPSDVRSDASDLRHTALVRSDASDLRHTALVRSDDKNNKNSKHNKNNKNNKKDKERPTKTRMIPQTIVERRGSILRRDNSHVNRDLRLHTVKTIFEASHHSPTEVGWDCA